MKRRIYIAGNMSSAMAEDFNRAQFNKKAEELREAGWEVINPVDLDDAAGENFEDNFDAYAYARCAERDLAALDTCDAIYMMHGWDNEVWSKGACWEWAYMKKNGKDIYYETPRPVKAGVSDSVQPPNWLCPMCSCIGGPTKSPNYSYQTWVDKYSTLFQSGGTESVGSDENPQWVQREFDWYNPDGVEEDTEE